MNEAATLERGPSAGDDVRAAFIELLRWYGKEGKTTRTEQGCARDAADAAEASGNLRPGIRIVLALLGQILVEPEAAPPAIRPAVRILYVRMGPHAESLGPPGAEDLERYSELLQGRLTDDEIHGFSTLEGVLSPSRSWARHMWVVPPTELPRMFHRSPFRLQSDPFNAAGWAACAVCIGRPLGGRCADECPFRATGACGTAAGAEAAWKGERERESAELAANRRLADRMQRWVGAHEAQVEGAMLSRRVGQEIYATHRRLSVITQPIVEILAGAVGGTKSRRPRLPSASMVARKLTGSYPERVLKPSEPETWLRNRRQLLVDVRRIFLELRSLRILEGEYAELDSYAHSDDRSSREVTKSAKHIAAVERALEAQLKRFKETGATRPVVDLQRYHPVDLPPVFDSNTRFDRYLASAELLPYYVGPFGYAAVRIARALRDSSLAAWNAIPASLPPRSSRPPLPGTYRIPSDLRAFYVDVVEGSSDG